DVVARFALFDECAALGHLPELWLCAGAHDGGRPLPLQLGFDGRRDRLGVLAAPWCVRPEGVAVPLLEVGQPRLGCKVPVCVVDPVAWERAGPDELERRTAVR